MGIEDHIQKSIEKYKRYREDTERQARAYLTEELQRLREDIGNREFYVYRGKGISRAVSDVPLSGCDVSTAKEWGIVIAGSSSVKLSVAFQGKSTWAEGIGEGNILLPKWKHLTWVHLPEWIYLPEWDISIGEKSLTHSLDYDLLTEALDLVQNAANLGEISANIPRGLWDKSDSGKLERALARYDTLEKRYNSGPRWS